MPHYFLCLNVCHHTNLWTVRGRASTSESLTLVNWDTLGKKRLVALKIKKSCFIKYVDWVISSKNVFFKCSLKKGKFIRWYVISLSYYTCWTKRKLKWPVGQSPWDLKIKQNEENVSWRRTQQSLVWSGSVFENPFSKSTGRTDIKTLRHTLILYIQ